MRAAPSPAQGRSRIPAEASSWALASATDVLAGIITGGPAFGYPTGYTVGTLGTSYENLGAGIYSVVLDGIVPGTGYTDLMSSNDVAFNNVTLNGTLSVTMPSSYVPAVGEQYILINNQSGDPVAGIFETFQSINPNTGSIGSYLTGGITEGTVVTINGYNFVLSYKGVNATTGVADNVILTCVGSTSVTVQDSDGPVLSPITTAVPGQTTTFTVIITNNTANAGAVAITDLIPSGVTSDTYTATGVGSTGFTALGSGSINDANVTIAGNTGGYLHDRG